MSADLQEVRADGGFETRVGLPRMIWRHLRSDPAGMVGFWLVVLFILMGAVGPLVAPYDPNLQDLSDKLAPPSLQHPFGTDVLGRDVLSRILAASRTGLMVALAVTAISTTIGVVLGALAGYFRGWVDAIIGRLIDLVQSFPYLLFVIFANATLGPFIVRLVKGDSSAPTDPNLQYVIVIATLGMILWGGSARLVRGQVLSLNSREFVLAARAEGARSWWIIRTHLLPHAIGPVIVSCSLIFGGALLLEASLSFLGIGIRPPTASLGSMIEQSYAQWRYHPGQILAPSLVLAMVLVGASLFGDSLNDALDPKRRRR